MHLYWFDIPLAHRGPMKTRESGGLLVVRDIPVMAWLAALLFGAVGTGFIGILINDDQGPMLQGAALVVGVAGIGIGGQLFLKAPVTRTLIDTSARRVELRQTWLLYGRRLVFDVEDLVGVEVEEHDDSDGPPCWRPVFVLTDGRRVAMAAIAVHDREHVEGLVRRAQAALRGPV
jgi:hypothetical protein